jgi:tetratricopeptide (TPR) repeat protein
MRHERKLYRISCILIAATFVFCFTTGFCQQNNSNGSSGNAATPAQNHAAQNQSSQNGSSNGASSASQGNAFPMAQSEAAAKADEQRQAQQNAPQSTPNATGKPQSTPGKSATAKDNPFPEAQSEAAAKKDNNGSRASGKSQPATANSGGGYSSSDAHLPPPELGQGNLSSHRKVDTFTRDQTQDGRIRDDLNVADLYMKNGDYRGALLRYQDALEYDPQNDTALYGEANSMCKQNLTAEAMAHFKSYAKANPQGKYALKAERMLAHPNKCMHNF